MKLHDLKISDIYFGSVEDGSKTFEIRKNDRDYKLGDLLRLREWGFHSNGIGFVNGYTGSEVLVQVTYVLDDEEYLQPNYVCMGIKKLT